MILGITGSIGSGKTTVANIFAKNGVNTIDADKIAHRLMGKNSTIYKNLRNFFGDKILDEHNNIDRKKLGDIVFENSKNIMKLNSITHPIIIGKIKRVINKIKKYSENKNIVIDAPLLLETKSKNLVDKIIVVKCGKKNILRRLNKKYSKQKIERILNAQMPLKKKLKYADFVVDNNKDLNHLENQVKIIIERFGL